MAAIRERPKTAVAAPGPLGPSSLARSGRRITPRAEITDGAPTPPGDRLRWATRGLAEDPVQLGVQAGVAVVVLAYLCSLFLVGRPASGYDSVWDGWIGNAASLLPLVPIALRIASNRRHRSAWIALGIGVALYNVANLLYLFYDQNLVPIPSPAPSDAPYLASYAAFAVGLALMTQGAHGAVRAAVRLDGAVAGLALAAVAGLLWFGPVLEVSGRPLEVAVGMAYPICDLVLLFLLISGLAPLSYRPDLSMSLLLLGVGFFVMGDVVYLNQLSSNTYVQGTWLDGTWVVGLWLIGLAAWPREDRRRELRGAAVRVPRGAAAIPIAFGALSAAVLLAALVHPTSRVTSLLAIAALCLVVARMAMTLHDVALVERRSFEVSRADELTGLRNRRSFLEEGEARLDVVAPGRHLGIALIDLDGFKEINDSLGHACGDELLRIVAARFERAVGEGGTLSRIGGDEFAATVEVSSITELVDVGARIVASLSDPISLDGVTVRVSASLGVAMYPDHGASLAELLRCADVAMYEAKDRGVEVHVYRTEDDVNTRDRLAMVDDLRAAIEARELTLHFQPTLDLRTGSIHGVEALVRWRHPTFGLLYPDDFLPLAERTGMLRAMTRNVLDLAIDQLARLDAAGHRLHMSVNISRDDLGDEELPAYIDGTLARNRIAPERLTLEITEASVGEDAELSKRSTWRLRASGIHLSIDDFGVGYSALSQLLELPVDELKIDKAFVLALESDARARAVIRATVEVGRALGLRIVAEGIENSASLRSVVDLGIDLAQGYYIACPFTEVQLLEFLRHPADILAKLDPRR